MIRKNLFYNFGVLILLFFILSCSTQNEENIDFSERVKINLRAVGNQLLLVNKDSTSLILPITEIDDFKFQLSFENQLFIEPNTLVESLKKVFEKEGFSENYRVEVVQFLSKEVAYSYEINAETEKTIIPCAGRFLPKNKYLIQVKFLDKTSSSFNYSILFCIFIPLLLGVFYWKNLDKKKPKSLIVNNDLNATILGRFQFYPEQNKLVKEAIEINLSKKECELLEIFVANPNQIIKREELTKKVWEDNGVFVGRSLDTYISKLRKKLKDDENIKLTNAHGVGYKLELNS